MRKAFSEALYEQMQKNENIYVLTGDLGYKMWDFVRDDFPDRFFNVGAAEQAMLYIAIGLAQEGKIPVCYSITPFLLYRPFEAIRTYINHENIPVKLIGSGRDKDYAHDGFSHDASDDKEILRSLKNILKWHPSDEANISETVEHLINTQRPIYLNLRR